MSYEICVRDIRRKFSGKYGWRNLTWDYITTNDNILRDVYESGVYESGVYESGKARVNEGYDCPDEYNKLDDAGKTKYIRESEAIDAMYESYVPSMKFIHVLQWDPTDADVKDIFLNAPNVAIIEDNNDNYYIGITTRGADSSIEINEEIAYAYMVIDHCIPPGIELDISCINLGASACKRLIEFIREKE